MKKISLSVKGFFKLASALSSGHLFSGNALAKDIPPRVPFTTQPGCITAVSSLS